MTLISLNNEQLVAELIPDSIVNPKQLGAKGDEINDDTIYINKALEYKNVFISDGIYLINSDAIMPQSNSNIKLSNNALLKMIPNNKTNYQIIKISNKTNIVLEGGTLEGDKETHLATTGAFGMGIQIDNNSSNITIKI